MSPDIIVQRISGLYVPAGVDEKITSNIAARLQLLGVGLDVVPVLQIAAEISAIQSSPCEIISAKVRREAHKVEIRLKKPDGAISRRTFWIE